MIRFACPTCGHHLSAASNKAGSLSSCPACAQMVQVPGGDAADGKKPRREGRRAFFALVRFFLWGVCFAAVVLAVVSYFIEMDRKHDDTQKVLFSVQALVWIMGSYFLARTFDDSTKSLEELCARLCRRR